MPLHNVKGPDGQIYKVTAPEGATDEQIINYAKQNYLKAPPQKGLIPDWMKTRQFASQMARPALEAGGAVGGAALGTALGPAGTFGGGALGFGAGKAGADLLDRIIGVKKPLQSVPQALQEAGGNILQGTEVEMGGQIGGKVLGSIQKPLGKFIGQIGRVQSGVKPELGERLFKDPRALFSPSVEQSGRELGAIRKQMGMEAKPTIEDAFQTEASRARKTGQEIAMKLEKGVATPQELLKGAQATDDVIEATPMRQRNQRRILFEQKRKFTDALKQVAGPEREKAQQFSRSALASEFRKFFPVTKSGDVSVLRTLGTGLLEGGGGVGALLPTTALQSPMVAGAGISAAGGVNKALQNPIVRRIISALIAGRNANPNPQ